MMSAPPGVLIPNWWMEVEWPISELSKWTMVLAAMRRMALPVSMGRILWLGFSLAVSEVVRRASSEVVGRWPLRTLWMMVVR